MKKTYYVGAQLITTYAKDVVFDSEDTSTWYEYDELAKIQELLWEDLSHKRQQAILSKFEEDLENITIEPTEDSDVFEDCREWNHELEIYEQ